jgi:DNA-binding XRE family transcriptional regulator
MFPMQAAHPHPTRDLAELIRLERRAFAAKLRMARALIGLSQSEFGHNVGLTQRAIHKLEQGDTDPRRATARAIEEVWRAHGIDFEDLADGGFRVTVRPETIDRPAAPPARQKHSAGSASDVPAATKRRPAA